MTKVILDETPPEFVAQSVSSLARQYGVTGETKPLILAIILLERELKRKLDVSGNI